MDRSRAEFVGATALGVVASDPERLGLFLALSGIGPETLRESAAQPGFLLAVLDFVLSDDDLVRVVAKAADIAPTAVASARDQLAGPAPG
ncbi:DUF3572 domain-containing protein [Blastochloris viridis]|nr:DUF3572 domain-containing protein [Blastochloris viridis]BAS00749.1 hypothetical protein BV133_3155 [Blastochloris viridis]